MYRGRVIACQDAAGFAYQLARALRRADREAATAGRRLQLALAPELFLGGGVAAGTFDPADRADARGTLVVATDAIWDDCRHARTLALRQSLLAAGLSPRQALLVPVQEPDAIRAALAFEQGLRAAFCLHAGELPRFDLVALRMGVRGDIAGLHPASPALSEVGRLAVASFDPESSRSRVSLTLPVVNGSARLLVLAGEEVPAAVLHAALAGRSPCEAGPARMLDPPAGVVDFVVCRPPGDTAPATRPDRRGMRARSP